jgi:hypothetical protein
MTGSVARATEAGSEGAREAAGARGVTVTTGSGAWFMVVG